MKSNRHIENQARGVLTQAEKILARASVHLFNGDALTAMRMLRTAEQLADFNGRLRRWSENQREMHSRLTEAEREVRLRTSELDDREEKVGFAEQQLRKERERLKQLEAELNALYVMMRELPARNEDGPPPAMNEQTDSGVAP